MAAIGTIPGKDFDPGDLDLWESFSEMRGKRGDAPLDDDDNDKSSSINGLHRKSISLKLIGESGSFEAVIATLDVPDKDGDITRPGAIPPKDVLVSAFNHGSWGGVPPVGRATLREEGNQVIAKGQFNLAMSAGKDTFESVKFNVDLQEWSYGFKVMESGIESLQDKQFRTLIKLDPFEISPVLKGAGEGTRTLSIKRRDPGDEVGDSSTYSEQAKGLLLSLKSFMHRTRSLADLRADDGRLLSKGNTRMLDEILAQVESIRSEIKSILDEADQSPDARRVFAEYSKLRARLVVGPAK